MRTALPGQIAGYRPTTRIRETPAGTWYRAEGPLGRPAGLLLVDPTVDLDVLVATTLRCRSVGPEGVIEVRDLVRQGDCTWLITASPPGQTLADLLASPVEGTVARAATLLIDICETLAAMHAAGVVHGRIDARSVLIDTDTGAGQLAEWGTVAGATEAADIAALGSLIWLLADEWCAAEPTDGAALAAAAGATFGGLERTLAALRAIRNRRFVEATAESSAVRLRPTPADPASTNVGDRRQAAGGRAILDVDASGIRHAGSHPRWPDPVTPPSASRGKARRRLLLVAGVAAVVIGTVVGLSGGAAGSACTAPAEASAVGGPSPGHQQDPYDRRW